jgi:hypothetical protein
MAGSWSEENRLSSRTYALKAQGIFIEVDLDVGHLSRFEVERNGRVAAPYHRVPWADESGPVPGTEGSPHLTRLSRDFFCAPFAASDVEPAPAHGWPANAPWELVSATNIDGGATATFVLGHKLMGARVSKEFTLRDGHPFLYQRHIFENGSGDIPVANHAMVRLPNGGYLSFSRKRWAETPDVPLESDPAKGRSILAYPASSTDLKAFPTGNGGKIDLTAYPLGEKQDDIVMLVEAEDATLGWSAVPRPQESDLALMLKHPARLLWFSNGGRFYPPWNGRHRHVLGVEDACAYSLFGHKASISPNPLSAAGIPTAIRLEPDTQVDVRHVIGAVPTPTNVKEVKDIRQAQTSLLVEDADGVTLSVPVDTRFLPGDR